MMASTLSSASRVVLDVRGLSVRYGSFLAVDGVSMRVEAGEIFGLLGPNGAGKTSVIRALTTIVPVSGGAAAVGGVDLSDPVAVRARIGVLPESNGYPGAQSARAYLRFYGQLFGLDPGAADSRAGRLLEQVDLAGEGRRIASFSRGMRQRLGLARSLINEPVVLFLDEPTLGLDPGGKEDILDYLVTTARRNGTCVILCTHLLDEVERVCDRVAIMHRGRIVADGTVEEVVGAAGVADHGTVRVAPPDTMPAVAALRTSPGLSGVQVDPNRPGTIMVDLGAASGAGGEALRRLLDAGIEPRSFDLHGGRLGEAFLALTGAGAGAAR